MRIHMHSLKKALSLGLLFQILLSMTSVVPSIAHAANLSSLQVSGMDTIAGYSALLTTTATSFANQNATFKVTIPSGEVLTIPAQTNSSGIAKADLSDAHTHTAGSYAVTVAIGAQASQPANFLVYPDRISAVKSTIAANRTVGKSDGTDQVPVTVTLTDAFGNPLSGHQVHLVSSRGTDSVVSNTPNGLSNKNGVVTFSVSSKENGVSTLSAIDTTSGTTLTAQAQIAFINGNQLLADVGGDLDSWINVAYAASGSLSHFDFTDLPENIQPGQNVGFKVSALDDTNQTVQNYTGKIHFSAEGSNSNNVTLPEDYTFTATDLGQHQFSLGLSFTTAGTYKIVVTDLNNPLIKGQKDVVVGSTGNGSVTQQTGSSQFKPTIETPSTGTYSQKIQTISGSAPASMTVKIFDNEQEIGSVQATSAGKFSFQTTALNDGVHKVYVTTLDQTQSVKGTSDTVQFSIDSTPPAVDELTLQPSSAVTSGQVVTIDVKSEENLSQAAALFNGDIVQLNPALDKPDHYNGAFQTPATAGIYPLDIILVDQLGNEGSYKAKAQVTVNNGTPTETQTQQTPTIEQTQETQIVVSAPSKVSGLLSYAGDQKVTLVWDASLDANMVKHYRVYFGTDPSNLDQHADTKDAGTTWYIPNLTNGRGYYFALTAFNADGVESATRSDVVGGTPYATEISQLPVPGGLIAANVGGNDTLHGAFDAGVQPRDIPGQSGPELLFIASGAGFLGLMAQKWKKRK